MMGRGGSIHGWIHKGQMLLSLLSFPRSSVGMQLAALLRRMTAKRSRRVPTRERGNQKILNVAKQLAAM